MNNSTNKLNLDYLLNGGSVAVYCSEPSGSWTKVTPDEFEDLIVDFNDMICLPNDSLSLDFQKVDLPLGWTYPTTWKEVLEDDFIHTENGFKLKDSAIKRIRLVLKHGFKVCAKVADGKFLNAWASGFSIEDFTIVKAFDSWDWHSMMFSETKYAA